MMMRLILASKCRAVNQTDANPYWTLAHEVVAALVAVLGVQSNSVSSPREMRS